MKRFFLAGMLLVLAALLVGGVFWLGKQERSIEASITVAEAMTSDTTGYERVTGPRTCNFPDDHGPHEGYKAEWWYFTGNLDTASGRHFGYQFTIFRFALAPSGMFENRRSAWAADQLYMAHFTLTDVEEGEFYYFERFSRSAAGLAGAQAAPFRVWLEDWSVTQSGSEPMPARIAAAEGDVALDLVITPEKTVVLQGDRGYDRKGPRPGDASYYYSIPRLRTTGHVQVGEDTFEVEGTSWMDREWSTSALGENQVGWDWFSLQLDNGYDLMYYQIRERDGAVSSFSDGVLVGPDGTVIYLAADDVEVDVTRYWESPRSGARYPALWQLHVPSAEITLDIEPYVADQELDVLVRYWEGAVRIRGRVHDADVRGYGYIELTGYGDDPPRRM